MVVGFSGAAGLFGMAIRRAGGLFEESLTDSIIGAFFEVYSELGYGFLESVYLAALERELRNRGHSVTRELSVRVIYKGEEIAWQRLDMVIDGKVVIEVKASDVLPPASERQLYNYLRSTKLNVGLLLHFGPKPFIKRVYVARSEQIFLSRPP